MALYQDETQVKKTSDKAFDQVYKPGDVCPASGIYSLRWLRRRDWIKQRQSLPATESSPTQGSESPYHVAVACLCTAGNELALKLLCMLPVIDP